MTNFYSSPGPTSKLKLNDFRDSRLNWFGVKTWGRGFTQNNRVSKIKKPTNQNI